MGLDPQGVRYALSYTAQQASGITSWARDSEHVEKSFVFGGNGARSGVTSALFVESGMSGEEDAFEGENGFLDVFCPRRDEFPRWVASLGDHYEITLTNIKKFSVGSPIQAAAEAMTSLVTEHNIAPSDIREVEALLPPQGANIVNGRHMPDVNLQYCLAVIALDGGRLTFQATHTYERMSDPEVAGADGEGPPAGHVPTSRAWNGSGPPLCGYTRRTPSWSATCPPSTALRTTP